MAAKKLTTKDLVRAFGVTPMTITNWRKGTPTREPLPFQTSGHRVQYEASKVKRWAVQHELPLVAPLESLGRAKPGPKVRASPGP